MKEYLGLLNKVHEGVIVIADGEDNEEEKTIKFCSHEASKILKTSSREKSTNVKSDRQPDSYGTNESEIGWEDIRKC